MIVKPIYNRFRGMTCITDVPGHCPGRPSPAGIYVPQTTFLQRREVLADQYECASLNEFAKRTQSSNNFCVTFGNPIGVGLVLCKNIDSLW